MTEDGSFSRRQVLATALGAGVASLVGGRLLAQQAPTSEPATRQASTSPTTQVNAGGQRYKISACDWIMLKRQTPGAVERAKQCGLDGVEADMGSLSKNPTFTNKFLGEPGFADNYLKVCRDNGIEISSIAMSGYYAQSFPERPFEQPLKDCIATCKLLGVKTAFLPLGVYSDFGKRPWNYVPVVDRLKQIGEWAHEAGIVIGIESSLPAESEAHMLDQIGSKAIKSAFNFENPVRMKLDIAKELQTLGKDRIAEIHPTNEDVVWLQDDRAIDMPKVKETLDAMGWSGWLVIERSRSQKVGGRTGDSVIKNFSANGAYLKSIFQA